MLATLTLIIAASTLGLYVTNPLIAAAIMADLGTYAFLGFAVYVGEE